MGEIFKDLRMFYALMDHIPDSIYFKEYKHDGNGGFTGGKFARVSAEKAKHYGLKIRQIRGKTDFDLLPKSEAQRSLADDIWVLTHREAIRDRIEKITRPNGEVVWVSATKIPWIDSDGCIHGIIGISRNITRRIAAEEERNKILKIISTDIFKPFQSIYPSLHRIFRNTRYCKMLNRIYAKLNYLSTL